MKLGMKSFLKKFLLLIVLALVVSIGVWKYLGRTSEPAPLSPTAVTYESPRGSSNNTNSSSENESKSLPSSLLVKVPFTPQAPTANWDELHNEACEEASAIMAHAYFEQIKSLPPEFVEREISKLTDWQNQNYGYHLSINTNEVAKMIREVYELKTEVVPISEQTIKRALADNKLVIYPANGQMLENPFFKQPGPIYHMLVITGYNEKGFITNDPGTKRGQDYQYSYDILRSANGNWDHNAHEVDLSDKRIIIVSQ